MCMGFDICMTFCRQFGFVVIRFKNIFTWELNCAYCKIMSSFFIKNKPKTSGKRKRENIKNDRAPKKKSKEQDEEIESDDAIDSGGEHFAEVSDNDQETAQDKRLRLAKKYLEEIEKEEQNRAEDKHLHDHVSRRLKDEYLDSIGKLRKNLAASYKGYNIETLKEIRHALHKLPLTTVIISGDNKIMFSGSKTPFVVKWDLETFKPLGSFNCQTVVPPEHEKKGTKRRCAILAMSMSSDMKFLAVAEGGRTIQIWCPETLKHLKTFRGHRDTVTSLVFRKDTHQLYSASKDRSVKIWSLDEMAYIESLFGHQSAITGIDALFRERAITAGGTDCSVRIWKITEESQLIYNGHRGTIEIVKLINDENFISGGDDGSLCLWSTMKKKPLCVLPEVHGKQINAEANWISAIATLVNTDLIASGSSDGFIRLWRMSEHGRKLLPLFNIPVKGFVNNLAFTNNGSHLIAAIGQEHRLGRWWRIKEAKNMILVIELETIKS